MNLTDLFPTSAAKILDALLENPGLTYTQALLANKAGLDERTVRRVVGRLARLGVLRVDRQFSGMAVVSLGETDAAQALLDLYQRLER